MMTERVPSLHESGLIELARWRGKFRVLDDWIIELKPPGKRAGRCYHNKKKKIATIYDLYEWDGVKGRPKDFIFHEILHIAMKAVGRDKDLEEVFIQNLCAILLDK